VIQMPEMQMLGILKLAMQKLVMQKLVMQKLVMPRKDGMSMEREWARMMVRLLLDLPYDTNCHSRRCEYWRKLD